MRAARGSAAPSAEFFSKRSHEERAWGECTFEGGLGRELERGAGPAEGVLGVAPSRRHHLVEGRDSIALLELADALADFMDNTADVVALVDRRLVGHPFWPFPSASC